EDIFGVNDQDDTLMFDADKDLQGEEVVEKEVAGKDVSVVEEVNAASIATSVTARTTTAATTLTISMDEITLAKALIGIKTSRPNVTPPDEAWTEYVSGGVTLLRISKSLGEKDASKQGRISDIDANQDIYLVNVHRDEDIFGVNDQDDTLMFDADKDLQGEEVVEKEVAGKDVSVVEEVNAASIATSVTARTTTAATTLTISMDEITLAKALIGIKTSRPNVTPPDEAWTEYVSGGVTLLRISSTKHKETLVTGSFTELIVVIVYRRGQTYVGRVGLREVVVS
nr:hypothetical protein [Tanacetum cinerariifolium]